MKRSYFLNLHWFGHRFLRSGRELEAKEILFSRRVTSQEVDNGVVSGVIRRWVPHHVMSTRGSPSCHVRFLLGQALLPIPWIYQDERHSDLIATTGYSRNMQCCSRMSYSLVYTLYTSKKSEGMQEIEHCFVRHSCTGGPTG